MMNARESAGNRAGTVLRTVSLPQCQKVQPMASKSQVTIARLMATIAAFAVLFAVIRYQPATLVFAGPVTGSLWE